MRKEFRAFIVLSAAAAASALPALAADGNAVRVNVPFSFTAGEKSLPAGEYFVTESTSHVLTIGGKGGSAMLIGHPGEESLSKAPSLSFQRTDKGLKLREVSLSASPSDALSVGTR